MNKILVSSLITIVALGAQMASAQTYYPPQTYGTAYSGGCVNLSSDLSYGSRGSEVRQLQTFLVNQNFPGGGSWMITGNFRSATMQAVRNFQQQQGLAVTGAVDAATRAAIGRVGCGGTSGYNYNNYNNYNNNYVTPPVFNYNNPNINSTNCYYTYPYICNNNYLPTGQAGNNYNYSTVTLTSLSVTSAAPGTTVTIYGTGFDFSNNTVYFGTTPLANISSNGGTSLSFTVPSYPAGGTVSIYIANSHGASNALTFSVLNPIACGAYPYSNNYNNGYCGGCLPGQGNPNTYGYGSTYCPPINNTGVPYINYVSPSSGAVGALVTVYGSGFSHQGNSVHFGSGVIANLMSFDGTSLSFTVPSQLVGYGSQMVGIGTYNVSVSNAAGYTSNAVSFSVTSLGSYGAPTITSITGPTTLAAGVAGTWTLTIQNNSQNNAYVTTSVLWGDENINPSANVLPQTTYAQGPNTLTFMHTYNQSGTYVVSFSVMNQSGQKNTTTATVVVTGSTVGALTLASISPTSAHVGSQIVLSGTGFSALDNTVHFGIGGTQHVPSFNSGTTIYYTIPTYVSPCDVAAQGNVCAQNIQQVLPGPIQVYVGNGSNTTNVLMFQVQ